MEPLMIGQLVEIVTVVLLVTTLVMLYFYGNFRFVRNLSIAFSVYLLVTLISVMDLQILSDALRGLILYVLLAIISAFVVSAEIDVEKLAAGRVTFIMWSYVFVMLTGVLVFLSPVYLEGAGYIVLGTFLIFSGVRGLIRRLKRQQNGIALNLVFMVMGLHFMDFMMTQRHEGLLLYGFLFAALLEAIVTVLLVLMTFSMLKAKDEASYGRYMDLFNNSTDPILIIDDQVIVNVNTAAEVMFKMDRDQLIGLTPMAVSEAYQDNGLDSVSYGEQLFATAGEGKITRFKWLHKDINDKAIPCDISLFLTGNQEFAALIKDLSVEYAYEEALTFHKYYDRLTRLPDRELFMDRLQLCIDRDKGVTGLIAFNIDSFKEINDIYGHSAGDDMLRQVASRIQKVIGEEVTMTRIGGDQFVVLIEKLDDKNLIYKPIEKIRKALKEDFRISEGPYGMTASMGVAVCEDQEFFAGRLLANVDLALNLAKTKGKGQLVFFSEDSQSVFNQRVNRITEIGQGIEAQAFIPYYQPILDSQTETIIGLEALARWERKDQTKVFPDTFIPLAEETGLIVALGASILRQVCQDFTDYVQESPDFMVHVNLSVKQLESEDFLKTVEAILNETKFPPKNLEFELTESVFMDQSIRDGDILASLRGLGIGLALDDFGTGYSSLSYLVDMEVDTIKIDRKFVLKLPADQNTCAMLRFLTELVQSMGYHMVVEGVETLEQLNFLKAQGCNAIQGYYYYKPMPYKACMQRLKP